MSGRRWEDLIRDLESRGYRKQTVDHLRARIPTEDAFQEVRREIIAEAAASLSRAAMKVDHALRALELCGRDLEAATGRSDRLRLEVEFNRLRDEALKLRQELVIHREALGMRQNHTIETLYPIPPRANVVSILEK